MRLHTQDCFREPAIDRCCGCNLLTADEKTASLNAPIPAETANRRVEEREVLLETDSTAQVCTRRWIREFPGEKGYCVRACKENSAAFKLYRHHYPYEQTSFEDFWGARWEKFRSECHRPRSSRKSPPGCGGHSRFATPPSPSFGKPDPVHIVFQFHKCLGKILLDVCEEEQRRYAAKYAR